MDLPLTNYDYSERTVRSLIFYPESLFYRSGSAHGGPDVFPLGVSFCRGALEDGPRDAAGGMSAEHS